MAAVALGGDVSGDGRGAMMRHVGLKRDTRCHIPLFAATCSRTPGSRASRQATRLHTLPHTPLHTRPHTPMGCVPHEERGGI